MQTGKSGDPGYFSHILAAQPSIALQIVQKWLFTLSRSYKEIQDG